MNCESCECSIYIKEPVDTHSPGTEYKNKYYCYRCIDTIYFLEDSPTKNIQINKKLNNELKSSSKIILICPYCKINIEEKKCTKCNKIHPIYLRKKKKKKKK